MRAAGITPDQIEAAHQAAMAAAPAAAGQWETVHQRGYDASVRSEITAIRRTADSLQPHEQHHGYQPAATATPQIRQRAQPSEVRVELDDAGLEVD
jgi:hypothetical protein